MRSALNDDAYTLGTWLVLTVLLAATFMRLQDRLPRIFNLLFVLAGAVNAGAYVFNLWERISVYDELVHAYTSFALAAAFGYLLFHRTAVNDGGHRWRFVAAVAIFGLGVGLAWEAFEWLTGLIGDTVDTLIDLGMDTLGAIAAGLFCAGTATRARREDLNPDAATAPHTVP